jgi:hypothetical protein
LRRRDRAITAALPRLEGQSEPGDLYAALVQFQPEEVVAEDGVASLCRVESFLFHPHLAQEVEGADQEVSGATARVHHRDRGRVLWPAKEGARRWTAVFGEAEVVHLLEQWALGVACRPPGTEAVLKEEADHIVLGEELRYRRQLLGTDLLARLVDLILLLRLPELIAPAEPIV